MSTLAAAALGLALLGVLGVLPVIALLGVRWLSLVLSPVAGAIVTGLAAAAALSCGGPLLVWSWLLAGLGAVLTIAWWARRPELRPWPRTPKAPGDATARFGPLVLGGLLSIVAAGLSLRGLATPTVGFDTRALWSLRAGWMLHDHQQMLLDFKVPEFLIGQSGYPPLVSSEAAFIWGMTGLHTARLEVVVVALIDMLCLLGLAIGILSLGHRATALRDGWRGLLPAVVAAIVAPAVVLIGAGITEPFLTNGYADPMWSLSAAGAVLFGLILPSTRSNQAAAVVLLTAAGMSKQEGMFTALCILGLIVARQLGRLPRAPRRSARLLVLLATAGAVVGAMAAWPTAIAITGSRQVSSPLSASSTWVHRAHAVATGFSPSLHVLAVALAVSIMGGLLLRSTRRRLELGHDLWGWAGLTAGLVVVGGVLITGSAAIGPWIEGSVHRVTQFPAITGWLIVAVWTIVGATAAAGGTPTEAVPGRSAT